MVRRRDSSADGRATASSPTSSPGTFARRVRAAAVAAGILSFKDALLAGSARGPRDGGDRDFPDPGRMVGIATGVATPVQ
jgi:hypothetical protein